MKRRTISLPDDLDQAADEAAQRDDRTYSSWARRVIERAVGDVTGDEAGDVTGESRLTDLQGIAAAGLEESADANAKRVRGPNATEIIAASSTEGHARLAALGKIAKGSRR